MQAWLGSRRSDLGLRVLGILILSVAYLVVAHLAALRAALPQTITTFGLATLGFTGASAGSGLLLLGHHLFDEVEVSERWRRRSLDALESDGTQWTVGA